MEPKLRINGFEGDWEKRPLRDFAKKSIEKNTSLEYNITLTNSAEFGVINQREFFDHDISNEENIGNYYVIHNDDFVYNPRVSASAPVGPINRNRLGYSGVMSPLYLIFKVEGICKDYLSYFFKTNLWHNYMKLEGNTGARFDRLSISDAQFFEMPIFLPSHIAEQQKIADFFANLDSQITIQSQRLEKLKQIKAASLQSMFPQNGESTPKIRFNGFEGDWDFYTLSDCLEINNDRNKDNFYGIYDVLSVSDEVGIANQIKLLGRSYAGKSLLNYRILKTDQIVYTKSPLKSKPYGIIKVNKGDTGIVSVLYAVYDTKEGICPDYIHYYFEPTHRINNYLLPLVNKGAKNTMNISDEMALTGIISIPSLAEQQKIADYFTNLDQLISLQSQRLDKLKQIKAACLDYMFV